MQHQTHLTPGEGGVGVLPAPTLFQAPALAGLVAPAPLVLLASQSGRGNLGNARMNSCFFSGERPYNDTVEFS